MTDMEITKREILASIAIGLLMLALGCAIAYGMKSSKMESDRMVQTAVRIDGDTELFEYGMRTSVGRALIYGDLTAVRPVSAESVPGEYMRVTKVTERYTRHTRTKTERTSDGKTRTKTEVYYSWDEIKRASWHCDEVTLLGHVFPYGVIPIPMERYIGTVSAGMSLRYVYYASDASYTGTAYGVLHDDTMTCDGFYANKTIEEAEGYLTSDAPVIAFMIGWFILMSAVIIIFVRKDNNWLEG